MADDPVSEVQLANAIEKSLGADASTYVSERLSALAAAGDEVGAQRFKEVAAQLSRLRSGVG